MRKLAPQPILVAISLLLAAIAHLITPVTCAAGTVDAYYQFRDYTDRPLNVRRVVITPIGPSGEYDGSFLSQKPINYSYATYPSLTNGYLLATNLITGYAYRASFSDGFGEPTVTNYFGTNLSGTVGAVTNKTSYIYWQNGVAVQINGPYFNATITNSGGGDAILRPSGSISIVTNATGDHTPIVNTNAIRAMTSTNSHLLDEYLVRAAGQVTADGDWLFGGALSGDAVSSWSIAADGDAEFNDLAATNITATSLAGAVLNQITNIVSGSAVSSAQVAAIMATNYSASDNMSAAMFYINTKLANRQPISILGYGDNQLVNVGAGGGFNESVIAALGTYLGRGGTKITSPTYVYSDGNGIYEAASGTNMLSQFAYWRLASGNSFTNLYASGAPDTSHLLLSYLDGTGFGSSAIWTNGAGTWGLCRTIPAASGSVRWNTTNISLGSVVSTLTVAVVSSGTNVVAAVGQYNTNSTKYVYDKYFVGNGDINTMMTNSTTSNQLFTVLNNYDLFFIADVSGSNNFYNGCLLLNHMITNNNFTVGVVIASGAPSLDSPTTLANTRAQRIAAQRAANDFGFGLLDTYAWFLPDTTNHLDPYFNDIGADRIHYDSKTSRAIGALFIEESGLASSLKESLLYTNTSVAGKANLAGGNNFTGNQVIGGYLQSTGSQAAIVLNHRNDNTRQTQIYGNGNGVFFSDSAESNPWMVKSNASGTMSLNFTPYGGAAVFNVGNSSFLRYWGDGVNLTNLQATNIVGTASRVLGFDASGIGTNLPTTGSGGVVLSNGPTLGGTVTMPNLAGVGGVLVVDSGTTIYGATSLKLNGQFNNPVLISGASSRITDTAGFSIYSPSVLVTNAQFFQLSVFPTNSIPLGSTTQTNVSALVWRGYKITVATNRAVGGWMWQTNGPSGAPVWGAFNPANQP